jgi:hypothetical protein
MRSYHQKLMKAVGGSGGAANVRGVAFDGSNDYLTRGATLTSVADTKVGTLSVWLRFNGGDGLRQRILTNIDEHISVQKNTSNLLRFDARAADFNLGFEVYSDTAYTASSGWLHILAAWSLGSTVFQLYVNDIENLAAGGTVADRTIDYTRSNYSVGGETNGGAKLNADIAEVYFNTAEYIDISVEANRRKFISATGKPVNLGADGSLPTTNDPILYLSFRPGEAVSAFSTNRGYGGGMSLTGTLTESSTSPGL